MMTREKAREWFLDHMPCKAIMPTAYSAYQNAVAALQGPTREMVKRMRGEWMFDEERSFRHIEKIYLCSRCKNFAAWGETEKTNFCPYCGAPMTDEAVEMVMKRMEALKDE